MQRSASRNVSPLLHHWLVNTGRRGAVLRTLSLGKFLLTTQADLESFLQAAGLTPLPQASGFDSVTPPMASSFGPDVRHQLGQLSEAQHPRVAQVTEFHPNAFLLLTSYLLFLLLSKTYIHASR